MFDIFTGRLLTRRAQAQFGVFLNFQFSKSGNDIAIDAVGLRFGFLVGQIKHNVANCKPPLRRFVGVVVVLAQRHAFHYTLRRNISTVMNI